MLYLAMEDFRVDVIVGKGPGATAIPLELRRSPSSVPPLVPASCRPHFETGSASPVTSTSTPSPTWCASCDARRGC
jgi:hypothetical protein